MKKQTRFVCVIAGLCGGSMAASGASIVNPSFEDGPTEGAWTRVNAGAPSVAGWEVVSGNVDHVGTLWQAAHGQRSIDLSGDAAGAIAQTVATVPGQEYVLSFALSGNWGGASTKWLEVSAGPVTQQFGFDSSLNTGLDMHWRNESLAFTAESTQTTLEFRSLTPGYFGPAIDDVGLAAVPGPATLLGVAAGVLVTARRRRGR